MNRGRRDWSGRRKRRRCPVGRGRHDLRRIDGLRQLADRRRRERRDRGHRRRPHGVAAVAVAAAEPAGELERAVRTARRAAATRATRLGSRGEQARAVARRWRRLLSARRRAKLVLPRAGGFLLLALPPARRRRVLLWFGLRFGLGRWNLRRLGDSRLWFDECFDRGGGEVDGFLRNRLVDSWERRTMLRPGFGLGDDGCFFD